MNDYPVLEKYPVIHTQDVQWGEMDALGHVNNTVYFRYFETARAKYLEKLSYADLSFDDDIGPIVASLSSDFLAPVSYPDTLHIGTGVKGMGHSKFEMEYTLVSEDLGEAAAEGHCVIVCCDYESMKPVRLPDSLRDKIEEFEEHI